MSLRDLLPILDLLFIDRIVISSHVIMISMIDFKIFSLIKLNEELYMIFIQCEFSSDSVNIISREYYIKKIFRI